MTRLSIDFKLSQPFQHGGMEISSVRIRRPKVADMITVQKRAESESEREMILLSVLADLPMSAVEEIDMKDYLELQRQIVEFMRPAAS